MGGKLGAPHPRGHAPAQKSDSHPKGWHQGMSSAETICPIQGEDPLSHSGGKEVQATRGYDLADHPEMEQARRSALNTQHAGCAPCQAHHATQHGPAPGSKSSTPRKIGAKIIHHQTPGPAPQ